MDALEIEDLPIDATDDGLFAKKDEGKVAATVTMYDMAVVHKLEESSKGMLKDNAYRIKGIINRIKKVSAEKRLVSIPEKWREYCHDLALKFPNFIEVVNFIRYQMALSFKGDKVLRLPSFLLIGEPGIGKTDFLLTLTSDLKTTLVIIDVSAAQTGVVLTGSEAYWSNTRTGELFDTLVFGEVANPIFMLDEIDKGRSGDYKPLAALHQLLEPRQAKIFKDLSLTELVLDARHVIWVATANTVDNLEKQIIDRFTIFNIATGQQRLQSLFTGLCGSYEGKELYFDVLSGEIASPDDIKFRLDFRRVDAAGFPWVLFKSLVFTTNKKRN